MVGLVFGSMGYTLVIFIVFYMYKWLKYLQSSYKSVPCSKQEEEKDGQIIEVKSDAFDEDQKEPEPVVQNSTQSGLDYAIECCENKEEFDIYQV